jgi:hypothetical protein
LQRGEYGVVGRRFKVLAQCRIILLYCECPIGEARDNQSDIYGVAAQPHEPSHENSKERKSPRAHRWMEYGLRISSIRVKET